MLLLLGGTGEIGDCSQTGDRSVIFYTVGYGGRKPDEFVELLLEHGVRSIADVRIRPDRASMGSYARAKSPEKGIEKLLGDRGIAYHAILELGNLFRDREDWGPAYRAFFERAGRPAHRPAGWTARALLPVVRRETRRRMPPAGHRRLPGGKPGMDGRTYRVNGGKSAALDRESSPAVRPVFALGGLKERDGNPIMAGCAAFTGPLVVRLDLRVGNGGIRI